MFRKVKKSDSYLQILSGDNLNQLIYYTNSHSQIDAVVKYILSHEELHRKKPIEEEYLEMLEKNNIESKAEYLLKFFSGINDWD
jgi:hypothetical protein